MMRQVHPPGVRFAKIDCVKGRVGFLLVSSSLAATIVCLQPSFAQSSSAEDSAVRATLQSQTPGGTWTVIEAQVKNTLEQAGFKNIQVVPSSFIVQAEKQGQTLTLVIHSDGQTISYLAMPSGNAAGERPADQNR
jgi:hypothetical protein